MGAVDVIPFIPIKEMTTEETVELSKQVAERVWKEAGIPVFLYEESASAPHRQNLAAIRKGQFEGMAEKVLQPEWEPDFGGRTIHPSAGVVAVGCRPCRSSPLISTCRHPTCRSHPKSPRFCAVRAAALTVSRRMGVLLEDRNVAQVSINMTNFHKTPLYRVVELTKAEAARWGVHVIGTEIVGLTPMQALCDSAEYYLQIENFDFSQPGA